MEVVVVGGGVVGLSVAHRLAVEGATVRVVDTGRFGAGCSNGNAGWICPILAAPLPAPGVLAQAARYSLRPSTSPLSLRPGLSAPFLSWARRFLAATRRTAFDHGLSAMVALNQGCMESFDRLRADGVRFEEHHAGLHAGVRSPEALETMSSAFGAVLEAGYGGRMEVFDEAALRREEPAFSDAVVGGIRFPDERHVLPESLTSGLVDRLRHLGATLDEEAPVDSIGSRGDRWMVRTGDGEVRADAVVVAAGVGLPSLLRPLGVRLPIQAAKGYSITSRGRGVLPQGPLFMPEVKVGCSPYEGRIRLVGTFELGARHDRVVPERVARVRRAWGSYLREWRPEAEEVEWAGLRPMTPDSLPVIGSVPGHEGLFVAGGHGMLGVSLAPVTAELLASRILGGGSARALEPFRPDRF